MRLLEVTEFLLLLVFHSMKKEHGNLMLPVPYAA